MKKYLLFMLLCILLASPLYAKRRIIVLNKFAKTEIEWTENKRSIEAFMPLVINNGDLFYVYSESLMQEAKLTIKDKYNAIVYSTIITVLPNEETAFTLPINNGEYIIELECNEDYYYGYFEIDQ